MFLSKKTVAAMGGALMLTGVSTSAMAIGGFGDIVYDPTNYAQAVKQVQAWSQQFNQMRESIQKAQATYERVKAQVDAVTGVRGFGDLLNNPVLRYVVPSDLSATLTSLNSTGLLTGKALDLRTGAAVYDCGDLTDSRAKTSCQVLLGQNAQALAFQQDTLALLNQRSTQIDGLRAQINATQDPKAIAELQARIGIEEAQVSNDQNKLLIAQAMLETNRRSAAQAEAERVNALMATNKTSVLDNFSFTGLGYAAGPNIEE